MNRNDYRRAFIMLRPSLPGYSGHVRLERRTMMGSMYFTASGPEDAANCRPRWRGSGAGNTARRPWARSAATGGARPACPAALIPGTSPAGRWRAGSGW